MIKNFEDWWEYAKMTPFYEKLVSEYNEFNNEADNSAMKTMNKYKEIERKNFINMLRTKHKIIKVHN